jgi:hypothetical protein
LKPRDGPVPGRQHGTVPLLRRIILLAPVRIVAGLLVCTGVPILALGLTRRVPPAAGQWIAAVRWIGATVLLLASYALLYGTLEKRAVSELSRPRAARELLWGLTSGAGAIVLAILLLLAAGCYRVDGVQSPDGVLAAVTLLAFLATAEEVIFRGILQRIVEGSAGTGAALILSNAAFAYVHTGNSGASLLSTAVIGLAGVLLGLLFMLTRRLWLPIAFHLGWNLAQVLAGTAVSGADGLTGSALLQVSQRGATWLSGGAFGPEGSVVTLVLVVALAAGLYGALAARRSFVSPPWRLGARPVSALIAVRGGRPVTPS